MERRGSGGALRSSLSPGGGPSRRRFLCGTVAAVTAVLLAALGAASLVSEGAIAAAPSLTGSWLVQGVSNAPPWKLQASPDLSTVSGSWTDAPPHNALMGTFTATLNSSQTAYTGPFHVTELSVVVDGTITFTIVAPNQLNVTTVPNNGGATSRLTLIRSVSQGRTIHASFQGYANDVKVVAPLVGPYQLGISHFNGNITITQQSGGGSTITGTISDSNRPRFSRYPANSMTALVTGYSYYKAPHGAYTKLTLAIEILDTNGSLCASGDSGTLTLLESAHKLSNGQRSDAIGMAWGRRCPSFVQGWTNANGGLKTSPHYGGPPSGGQWAIVRITP